MSWCPNTENGGPKNITNRSPKMLEKILYTRRSEWEQNSTKKDSVLHVKIISSKHFWMLVNKIRKNFVYILVLCVKLQHQQIQLVEMRAKFI